jgi:hypothetical protein
MRKFHFLIALGILLLDRAAKWAIAKDIALHDSISVIPGFFRLTHVENSGAAFGLFADSPSQWKIAVLVLFSIVALVIVSALLWRNSHSMTSTGQFMGSPGQWPRGGLPAVLYRQVSVASVQRSRQRHCHWGGVAGLRNPIHQDTRR